MSTGISYCDETWNPVVGCSPVSEGCANCWAVRVAHRGMCEQHRGLTHDPHNAGPQWRGDVRLVPTALEKPLSWGLLKTCLCCDWESGRSWCPVHVAEGARTTRGRVVLTPSMGDMFHDDVPNEYIAAWFGVMGAASAHTFLVLTKRIERVRSWLDWARGGGAADACSRRCRACAIQHASLQHALGFGTWPPPNVLIGISVESKARAEDRFFPLGEIAARGWRTWISFEPIVAPVWRFQHLGPFLPPIEFAAIGAETGPSARPCDEIWIRAIVQKCRAKDVRCHVKALTGHRSPETWPEDLRVREMPRHG